MKLARHRKAPTLAITDATLSEVARLSESLFATFDMVSETPTSKPVTPSGSVGATWASSTSSPELNGRSPGLHARWGTCPRLGNRVGGARGIGQGTEGRLLANKFLGSHEKRR